MCRMYLTFSLLILLITSSTCQASLLSKLFRGTQKPHQQPFASPQSSTSTVQNANGHIFHQQASDILRNPVSHSPPVSVPVEGIRHFTIKTPDIAIPVEQLHQQQQQQYQQQEQPPVESVKQMTATLPMNQLIEGGPIVAAPGGAISLNQQLTFSSNASTINGDQSASPTLILPVFVPALPPLHLSPVNTFVQHLRTKPGSPQSKTCNLNPKATHELRSRMYSNSAGFGSKTILVECKANIERMKAQALANANY